MALLFLLLTAVSLSAGFNIDVLNPETFKGNKEDYFGYRLLQYQSDRIKQLIVSAPLSANKSGAIFKCPVEKKECKQLFKPDSKVIRFFGMSMAIKTSPSTSLTSCSPSFTHECDGNSYLNGICYQFNSRLELTTNITAAFQECTKSKVNLVFLLDGSQSMSNSDFNLNKKFIWEIMTNLKNSSIQFAAVQFSFTFRTVFNFKDYVSGSVKMKLDKEPHMNSLTNTHGAINYVLKELFGNVESGADPEATKGLVIITDGVPSDDNVNEIHRCEELNIERFIIGVGKISNLTQLKDLASEPKDSNIFMIENYSGLNELLDKLQKKIYGIEGVKGQKFAQELSQSGFSTAADKDSLIVGAVGVNDWTGALYDMSGSKNQREFRGIKLKTAAYNGYSVVLGRKGKVPLVFSGAPRFNHSGQVTLFRKMSRKWEAVSNISGEQIGSYFGGSVCVLDLDSNNDTDFLVVGAPLYYSHLPRLEGRVYIYKFTEKLEMVKVSEVYESAQGRFGMSLAAVADLNGDQLQDLAVGAPLEENHQGAIYIYLGKHQEGIRHRYSQRIVASCISSSLQHFGLAVDGVMDMGQDGLTDIAVGAKGAVLLLKSRPVVSVSAKLTYSPSYINLTHFDCLNSVDHPAERNEIFMLNISFLMTEKTRSKGTVQSGLNISWELTADAMRQDSRAFFVKDLKTSRNLVDSVSLGMEMFHFTQAVYMPRCVKDMLSPVVFRLNFKQSDPHNSTSILDIDCKQTDIAKVRFKINYRNTSDLQLNFIFLNSTLLVVDQASFIIQVTLVNKGDDSFNTSLVLFYPPGLSLSVFKTIKPIRRSLSRCGDGDEGALNKTTCSISLPVFPKNMHAVFEGVFRISRLYSWNDRMQMTLVASSDNNRIERNSTVMKTLPVQFSVDVAISHVPELSVKYLNFSLDDKGPKPVSVVYWVSNLGLKGLPVSVRLRVPSQTAVTSHELHNFTVTVSENRTACDITPPDRHDECLGERCVIFRCGSFLLDPESAVQFVLSALITFPNKQEYTGKWGFSEFKQEDEFSVSAQLNFNKTLYQQLSSDRQNRFDHALMNVKVELVIPPDLVAIRVTGGVGGLLLLLLIVILLWRRGFFKRQYHAVLEENDGNENWTEGRDMGCGCGAATDGQTGEAATTAEEKPFILATENDVSENGM